MAILQGFADIAAIILTIELFVMLVVPAFLVAIFGRRGMKWVLVKFAWAMGKVHEGLAATEKGVRRAEDLAVTPVVTVASFWAGAGTTLRSLRRRADQPLARLRRSG
jgi:hypothetical protein